MRSLVRPLARLTAWRRKSNKTLRTRTLSLSPAKNGSQTMHPTTHDRASVLGESITAPCRATQASAIVMGSVERQECFKELPNGPKELGESLCRNGQSVQWRVRTRSLEGKSSSILFSRLLMPVSILLDPRPLNKTN